MRSHSVEGMKLRAWPRRAPGSYCQGASVPGGKQATADTLDGWETDGMKGSTL
jgi:hypothetical protein